ncbi:MAG: hypothetical protein MUF40_02820, partial [Gemmatimonadaceae bacterium]|nr:hypothetical protein [Gemmatimonadaceae bacterium]
MRVLAVLPAVSVVLAGCVTYESSPRGADSAAAPAAAAPAAAPAAVPAAPAAPADAAPPRASGGATMDTTLTGTVREQIPVGPYVYLRLETTG